MLKVKKTLKKDKKDPKALLYLVFMVNVWQPAFEVELLEALKDQTSLDAKKIIRNAIAKQLIWRVWPEYYSVTKKGKDFLKTAGLNNLRNQRRVFFLKKQKNSL